MKLNRLIQLATGVHRIHDIHRGYGYKLPFCLVCRFDRVYPTSSPVLKWYEKHWGRTNKHLYHDCTITGVRNLICAIIGHRWKHIPDNYTPHCKHRIRCATCGVYKE